MSEIVCPACRAKYRVPDGAIGAKGRRVSCSNCGEVWLAKEEPQAPRIAEATGESAAAPGPAAGGGPGAADPVRPQPGQAAVEAASGASPDGEADDFDDADRGGQRRRRSWRDLTAAREAASSEADVAEDRPESGPREADPFEARLAKLRASAMDDDDDEEDGPATGARRDPTEEEREALARHEAELWENEAAAAATSQSGSGDDEAPAGEAEPASPYKSRAPGAGAPVLDRAASRDKQMAEIREMLTQLQAPDDGRGEPAAESDTFAAERDAAGIDGVGGGAGAYRDPLREKLLDPEPRGRTGAPKHKDKGSYERDGLMRKHQKRNRRRQVAERSRKSMGGFYSALTLMVLAFAMLVGVYAFHERIIASYPASRGPVLEYVAAVDTVRGQLGQQVDRVKERTGQVIEEVSD